VSYARRVPSQRVRAHADGGVQVVEARAELGYAVNAKEKLQRRRELYVANSEKILAKQRARYAADPETRERYRASGAAYRAAYPERYRAQARARYAKNPEPHRERTRKYAGLPAPTRPCPTICEVVGCTREAKCLDHEHLTHTFRGWLCRPCNLAASKYHTATLLRALADYVERHS
jgi:hypothetical protein